VIKDIPQSNRDFFTKPGRKGISFQSLISKISIGEDINNILPITNEISFCSLSINYNIIKHGVSVAKDVITICNIANYIRMTESIVTIFTQSSGDVFQ
jgi:hypothetical protein